MSPSVPKQEHREGPLRRLADAMFVHRRKVVLAWVVVLALAVVGAMQLGGTFTADYDTPGSGSKAASERLDAKFAGRSGEAVDIVWKSPAGATSPAVTARIDRLLEQAGTIEGIVPGTKASTAEVSPDGRTAIARLPLDRPSGAVNAASGERIAELLEETSGQGLQVAANGSIAGLTKEAGMSAELVGVGVAAVVLLVTFGTVVAAGLPLLIALLGVAIAVMLGAVLAAVVDTPDWAVQVSLMIGLGVGIDYALLILTRYRAALRQGRTPRDANVEAMTTAGHAVLVAGATVVIALMGLFLMRLPYLNGVALAASLAVLVVMAATATLLPAVLGFVGRGIDRLQIGRFGRPPTDPERAPGARWARAVHRRPVIAAIASLLVLAVLASPLTGIRFGFPDAGNDARQDTTRQAYDMVAQGFGPGANGPLIAVATTEAPGDRAAVQRLRAQIERDPDVVAVAPPQYNDAGDTAMIAITPTGGPSSASTKELVERLREGPLADAGVRVDLGGQTAATVDQSTVTANRLPLFIGAVVALSFLLLLGAFRAPIIALKAGVMTVLSIAASYGVVALVAEGGWAGQLVGIDSDLPVPPFIPVMMFAVLFGLSMDYEVFLVSRIKEERERLGDARTAVTVGLARTAKVIMAAALIMVSVFGAFALSPALILKLIGVGLASAILIDAVIVRMVLVPAVMRLLGERAWWTPGRGGRRDPRPAGEEPGSANVAVQSTSR
jgi:RND superfamily putative drug exporter